MNERVETSDMDAWDNIMAIGNAVFNGEEMSFNAEYELWSDDDLEEFGLCGEDCDIFEFVKLDFAFAKLNEKDIKVLAIVSQKKDADLKTISEATKIDRNEVKAIIEKLTKDGLINTSKGIVTLSDKGAAKVEAESIGKIELRYKYVRDESDPDLLDGSTSRPFCEKLMKLNRLYTREDIDTLSAKLGYNVWERRGGWYHNPETNVNEIDCRHIWQQVIVRRK